MIKNNNLKSIYLIYLIRIYRSELYISGGILSITSRILIIDLLQKRIPSYLITGILVMHAERYCIFFLYKWGDTFFGYIFVGQVFFFMYKFNIGLITYVLLLL